jgi:hypothetical protein
MINGCFTWLKQPKITNRQLELVFYKRVLQCFILFEIQTDKLMH